MQTQNGASEASVMTQVKNTIEQIREYGQSIWMDYLDRELIESGELKRKVDEEGIRGITSNPKTFSQAVMGRDNYDADIKAAAEANQSIQDIYEALIFKDIQNACDIFRPVYEASDRLDGYVSIELPPAMARDTDASIKAAKRYFNAVDRENVMIKIPGTKAGMPAIQQCIADGINVNVTLLFSLESYEQAAWAYIQGLEERAEKGEPIDKIASVASFFLSRINVKIDQRIQDRIKTIGTENLNEEARLQELKGTVAIANAKVAYEKFKAIFGSDRWKALEAKGAQVQRVLWASTSTKNPEYSDVMYVDTLIGLNTINTLPPETIAATLDHAHPGPNRVEEAVEKAHTTLNSLSDPDIQIDLDQVMDELIEEGIQKFADPYDELMRSLEAKTRQLTPA